MIIDASRLSIKLPKYFYFSILCQHFSTILLQQFPTFYVTICYHSCYHLLSFRLAIVSILASSIFTSVFIATVVNRTTVSINTLVAITYVTVTTLVIFAGTALWSRQYLINKNQRSNSFLCNYRQYFINKYSILSHFTRSRSIIKSQ